jgi:hypothetical protein
MSEPNSWHGKHYSDCNYDMLVMGGGCKWWHFHPEESFEAHIKKFNQVLHQNFHLPLSFVFVKLAIIQHIEGIVN